MSENINPNVEVQEEARAESKIGEMTSFEQLDRITDDQISGDKQRRREERQAAKEAKAEKMEADKTQEDDLPKPQGTEADAEITPTLGIDPESMKPIKLTYGEESYEILPTASVPVKIDGEKDAVPLQDLINNYSGKVAWDKRFNELNQEKQQFKTELRKFQEEKTFVDDKINSFFNLSQEDPIKAFDYLCEFSGKDPIDFQKNFRENLVQKFEEYYNMDSLSRREFDLSERERYLESKRQAETDKAERERSLREEKTRIQSTLEQFAIDDNTYHDVRSELSKAAPDAKIEPMHVIRYQRALMAQEVVREVRPDKAEDPAVIGELAAVLVQNPTFNESDLRDILSEIWKDEPSQASKLLSKKVLKTQTQAKPGQKPAGKNTPWSFDQI
jgi:hypothetical protein